MPDRTALPRIKFICLAATLLLSLPLSRPAEAEIISYVSIGCNTLEATQMAEQAILDKISGRDRNAFSRIDAYRKKAGQGACRPLNQGEEVKIVRQQSVRTDVPVEGEQDIVYACVRLRDESKLRPNDPDCYWIRYRHMKLPPGVNP